MTDADIERLVTAIVNRLTFRAVGVMVGFTLGYALLRHAWRILEIL